jgi:hypothetical protein
VAINLARFVNWINEIALAAIRTSAFEALGSLPTGSLISPAVSFIVLLPSIEIVNKIGYTGVKLYYYGRAFLETWLLV